MSEENIEVQQSNFCISPLIGTFASVDTTNSNAHLLFKNSTGDTTSTYTFNPNIEQDTTIYYLDYIGARNQSSLEDGMVFFTMESDESSTVTIKKWDIDTDNTRLNLDYTITKTTDTTDTFDCTSMAIGRYYTNLTYTVTTGTGQIVLDDADNVVSGTRLYVGPSSNTSYLDAYEEVIATAVSGTTVTITALDGSTALSSYFNSDDPVTYLGDTYLFCDSSSETNKGALITIDSYDGTVLDRDYSALYTDIAAANYCLAYSNTIAAIKQQQLVYIRTTDYTLYRSARVAVAKPQDDDSTIDVKALALTSTYVYRLQDQKVIRDDDGNVSMISWDSYNYHEDAVARYVDTIALYTDTATLSNQETITITACVRDQYGIAMSGKTVNFDKSSGDSDGTWGDVNQEAETDINGLAEITYTSGWFDSTVVEDVNEDIVITAYTNGSNVLTGSIYVWTSLTMYLNAKFYLAPDTDGVSLIIQEDNDFESESSLSQIEEVESTLTTRAYSNFLFPGGNEYWQDLSQTAIVQQWSNFESDFSITQEEVLDSTLGVTQDEVATGDCQVSQNFVSRHLSEGSNEDSVDIAQFTFIVELSPAASSEKNNVNTDIWAKLSPYGFDLNQSTLVFKVREVSYAGDTGWIDYAGTSNLTVEEYDAGSGLIGLEITYVPDEYFHNGATVYVYIDVYDQADPANEIEYDYSFTIIEDYVAPYIENEYPERSETDVATDTVVSFDILDTEVGVDIDTLELYINSRIKSFTYEEIDNGYTITYANDDGFYYDQTVQISVYAEDSSDQDNALYDMWRFYCESSVAPWVDSTSLFPEACVRGYDTRTAIERLNVYDMGDGIDKDSIELIVDGKTRPCTLVPIIKRVL